MTQRHLVTALAVLTTALAAAPATQAARLSANDKEFLIKDAHGGYYELEAARAVLAKKPGDAATRRLARSLVNVHKREIRSFKAVGHKLKLALPTAPFPYQQAKIDHIKAVGTRTAEKFFVEEQLADHTADVQDYLERLQFSHNATVKRYVRRWLPDYRHHIRLMYLAKASLG